MPPPVPAAAGEVRGQGTVLQVGSEAPELCLGGVAESYPPQCSGPPIDGWDWAAVDQKETANDVTWGTFAVQGTWDGSTFTLTGDPIPLSLYDPMPSVDPRLDENNPGPGTEDELLAVQEQLADTYPDLLSSWPQNGYVFTSVIYDDGTLQAWFDGRFEPEIIAVQPALQDVQ